MSESVASALEYMDNDGTQQTRVFIRMVDCFFDYLNVKSPLMAQMKRKESIAPYKSPKDECFTVSICICTQFQKYKHAIHTVCFSRNVVATYSICTIPGRMGKGSCKPPWNAKE